MGIDEVALCGEEARVARLEDKDLMLRRFEDCEVVGRHDPVPEYAVNERPVRHFQPDQVTGPHLVDVRERGQEGRPMPSDVDETALPRHERAEISARAALQGTLV